MCGAAGRQEPAKQPGELPCRRCALCAGLAVGPLPGGAGGIRIHREIAAADLAAGRPAELPLARPDYAAAQPRAPPRLA
jgi:hypothetical protein